MPATGRSARWRLRAIHRKMSFETFERTVPVRPGWKREYYGGKAHVRPSLTRVTFVLDLTRRAVPRVAGLRALADPDAPELLDAFLDSFRVAPEYCDYPAAMFRKKAAEYVSGFFGDVRGTRSGASAVVVRRGRVLAAALVKEREGKQPLLDCLLVRPAFFRTGLASAVVARAANRLLEAGFRELVSGALLANDASIAWHAAFGFRELPDLFVAQARSYAAQYEKERLEELGRLTLVEAERLSAGAQRWWAEAQRLHDLPFDRRHPGYDS